MSATATFPVSEEQIKDRLVVLMTGAEPNGGAETPSELDERLHSALRELAGRMVGGTRGDDEEDALWDLDFRLEQLIEKEIVAWAYKLELDRQTARAS